MIAVLRMLLAALLPGALVAITATTAPLLAQGGALAGVRGTVTDSLGAPVAGALVSARHEPTRQAFSVAADAEGRFMLANLAAGGPWTIVVQSLGHAPATAADVQLRAGSVHRLDFTLRVEAVTLPGVTVSAATESRFAQDRTGAATVLDRAAVAAHPTIQRNVMELAALAPMAAATEHGHTIAGQNTRFNALQLDGSRFQDMFGLSADGAPGGAAGARPLPIGAVEQFQVLVAPFDVRHSGFTGGLLNVVTRSGTAEWDVSAFGHYRDRSMMGSLDLPGGGGLRPDRIEHGIAGITIGGPLVADRLHVFAALEVERSAGPSGGFNLGRADPLAVGIAPDSALRMVHILASRYGMDAGEAGQVTLENPRENIFLRGDWLLDGARRLSLRHNYVAARRDMEPNRAPAGVYEFGSQVYRHASTAHATSLQFVTPLPARWSSETILSVHRMTDRTTPASTLPVIEVDVRSDFDGFTPLRTVRAGGHFEAQASSLVQDGAELRAAATRAFGLHLVTAGASAEVLRFHSLYLANPRGLWRFSGLAELEANTPVSFERTLLRPGAGDGSIRLSVSHYSAFLQDEWSATDRLTITGGMRVDLPHLHGRPGDNPELAAGALQASTTTLPATTPLVSPRVAFNWLRGDAWRTQLRGGVGLFAGRPAYSWLANAWAHTGMRTDLLVCSGARTPGLAAGDAPATCQGGALPTDIQRTPVVMFGREFRFPQDLRFALGFDQALPLGLVLTGDAIYARAFRQVFLRDINLGDPVDDPQHDLGYSDGFGFHARDTHGQPTRHGFTPIRRDAAWGPVIELSEQSKNRALAASAELSGRAAGLRFSAGYTFTRSLDVQTLVHRDAAANLGTSVSLRDAASPWAAHSDFDRPHRVVTSLAVRAPRRLGGADLSLLYIAESGAPYTYVYASDINGDGFPGAGTQDSFNDPVYVSIDVNDFPGSLVSGIAFMRMVAAEPCLDAWRGGILHRNQCRGPATHRFDMRAAQAFRVAGAEVSVVADVLNVLRLLGSERGIVQRVSPRVPLVRSVGRPAEELMPNPERVPLEAAFMGGVVRDPDTGRLVALLPYTTDLAASRWQAQFGVEIRRAPRF